MLKRSASTDSAPDPLSGYRAAVEANPQSAEAHSNLGWGYYGQKKFDEAVSAYKEALQLNADLIDAHYGLGLTHKEMGAKAEALASFEKVLQLLPGMEDKVRSGMLTRLVHGHMNQINKGDWDLAKELFHRE